MNTSQKASPPLAERLRPQSLDQVVGQPHLLGPQGALTRAAQLQRLPSMILWGPPGVGKTTLARLLAQSVQARMLSLSAVLSGVKDVRDVIARAQHRREREGRGTILFVDEIHRFNKAQQDAFLPHVESGTIVLVGATTENPSFELNAALLSRCRVVVLEPLS
ncbi:MAG: AAA family ATPase, partial [Burkholderiaceae bacterium]